MSLLDAIAKLFRRPEQDWWHTANLHPAQKPDRSLLVASCVVLAIVAGLALLVAS